MILLLFLRLSLEVLAQTSLRCITEPFESPCKAFNQTHIY
jgi:hypothetical protein